MENYALLRMYFIWCSEESYSTYIYIYIHFTFSVENHLITHVPCIKLWWAMPHHTCTSHHTVASHTSSHVNRNLHHTVASHTSSHCSEPYLITNDQPHSAPVQDSGVQTEGLVGYDQHRIADPPSLLSHEVTWRDDNEQNKSHFIPAGSWSDLGRWQWTQQITLHLCWVMK